jgi:hypothetical protein
MDISLMLEAASTSNTLVNFHHTTQRNNSEGTHHTRSHENLESHLFLIESI